MPLITQIVFFSLSTISSANVHWLVSHAKHWTRCLIISVELRKTCFYLLSKWRNVVFDPWFISLQCHLIQTPMGSVSYQYTDYNKIIYRSTINACRITLCISSTCRRLSCPRIILFLLDLHVWTWILTLRPTVQSRGGTTDSSWKWFTSLAGITSLTYKPEVKISH